jgi:hypothetical protein
MNKYNESPTKFNAAVDAILDKFKKGHSFSGSFFNFLVRQIKQRISGNPKKRKSRHSRLPVVLIKMCQKTAQKLNLHRRPNVSFSSYQIREDERWQSV